MRRPLLLLVLLLSFCAPAWSQAHIGDSIGHMLVQQSPVDPWHASNADSCFELISFPDDYDANPTKKYPVIFFFHGLGQAGPADGSQLSIQLQTALPQFISEGLKPSAVAGDGNTYKFIVVCPQAVGGSITIQQFWYIFPDILSKIRADTTRLYITGLSYGGYGTWSCLTDDAASPYQGFISHFAAILPQSQVALDESINTGTATNYNRVAHVKDAAADSLPVLIVCGDADDKWQYSVAYKDSINSHNPFIPAILIDRVGQAHTSTSWDSIYSPTFRPPDIGGKNGYEWLIQYTNKRGYLTGVTSSPPGALSANAGTNQTITLPANSVTLTGSGSETNGTIASYLWTQLSGPSTATIGSAGQAATTVGSLVQGTYRFQLTVTDNSGVTATASVQVTVNAAVVPGTPVVNAGPNQSITLPTNSVTLTATASETNGTIVSYAWTQVSGPSAAALATPGQVSTQVTRLAQGVYTFQILITDNSGVTASDVVKVTVDAAAPTPGAPLANAGADQVITLPINSVTLSGSGSETNGTIVSYTWTQVSGPSTAAIATDAQATTAVSGLVQAGVYTFKLTVKDNSGVTANDEVEVTVNAPASSSPPPPPPVTAATPVAVPGNDTTIGYPASSITLNGGGSYVTGGTIVAYSWAEVSGPGAAELAGASSPIVVATGLVAGQYIFSLTVTDNKGDTASAIVKVTVADNLRMSGNVMNIYPNPVMGNSIVLNGTNNWEGDVTISLYDLSGRLTMTYVFAKGGPEFQQDVSLPSWLAVGSYVLSVTFNGQKKPYSYKLIKQ